MTEWNKQENDSGNRKRDQEQMTLAEQISEAVKEAVESMDFSGLSDRIRTTVRDTVRDAEASFKDFGDYARKQFGSDKKPGQATVNNVNPSEIRKQQDTSRQPKPQLPAVTRPVKLPGTWSGPLKMAFGGIGTAFFGLTGLGLLPAAVHMLAGGGLLAGTAAAAELVLLSLTGLSGFVLGDGIRASGRVHRIRDYISIWKERSYIMFSELAEKTGRPARLIRKDIRFLLNRNLLPGSRTDERETCLLLKDDAIALYEGAEASRKEREEKEAKKKKEEEWMAQASDEEKRMYEFFRQSEEVLEEIDERQAHISSRSMQEKIDRFELSLTRIFLCVKNRPDKLRKTNRLMEYYIPSVMKLMAVYEDMEKQPIQGENISGTCREIEDSMDTINNALEVMYDEMFQEDALDVSADIKVLRAMLAQDGWTDSGLSGSALSDADLTDSLSESKDE